MTFAQITSAQNPKVRQVKKLRDRRERDKTGLFVIDDGRDLSRALDHDYTVVYALYCPALSHPDDAALLRRIPNERVYEVPPAVMRSANYRENPAGVLAVIAQKPRRGADSLAEQLKTAAPPFLALVGLEKPGNIGALLRTADAAGFTAVCLVDTALDVYNPNVIRSSTGACFLETVYTLSTQEALTLFAAHGYAIVAAVVDGDTPLYQADFRQRIVIALGTEDTGLNAAWVEAAALRVAIPMVGALSDSLNVSVSGAVFMYEVLRQQTFE